MSIGLLPLGALCLFPLAFYQRLGYHVLMRPLQHLGQGRRWSLDQRPEEPRRSQPRQECLMARDGWRYEISWTCDMNRPTNWERGSSPPWAIPKREAVVGLPQAGPHGSGLLVTPFAGVPPGEPINELSNARAGVDGQIARVLPRRSAAGVVEFGSGGGASARVGRKLLQGGRVGLTSRIGSTTSTGQLSEGARTWRLPYHSTSATTFARLYNSLCDSSSASFISYSGRCRKRKGTNPFRTYIRDTRASVKGVGSDIDDVVDVERCEKGVDRRIAGPIKEVTEAAGEAKLLLIPPLVSPLIGPADPIFHVLLQ
ncbi:hypothetical protein BHM03_00042020 [Ensete ventricosum]|nr:hypothetical protein BHM03_00042020 [Ensete ventricosum]